MEIVNYPQRPFIPHVTQKGVEIPEKTGFCLAIEAGGDTLDTVPLFLIVTERTSQPGAAKKDTVDLGFDHYLPTDTLPANRTISLRGFVCTSAIDAMSVVDLAISAMITPEARLAITRESGSRRIQFLLVIRDFRTTCSCDIRTLKGLITTS